MVVYFITDEARTRTKIGYTDRDPALRLVEIQCGVIPLAGAEAERWFHKYYADRRIKPRHEWFRYCSTMLTLELPPSMLDQGPQRVCYQCGAWVAPLAGALCNPCQAKETTRSLRARGGPRSCGR